MIREGDSHIFYDIERDVVTGHCAVCTVQLVKIYDIPIICSTHIDGHILLKNKKSAKNNSLERGGPVQRWLLDPSLHLAAYLTLLPLALVSLL